MKTISFYKTASGKCPVEDHLGSLTDNQVTKIAWVLKLIRELDRIPLKYLKNLQIRRIYGKSELMSGKTHSVYSDSSMAKI